MTVSNTLFMTIMSPLHHVANSYGKPETMAGSSLAEDIMDIDAFGDHTTSFPPPDGVDELAMMSAAGLVVLPEGSTLDASHAQVEEEEDDIESGDERMDTSESAKKILELNGIER